MASCDLLNILTKCQNSGFSKVFQKLQTLSQLYNDKIAEGKKDRESHCYPNSPGPNLIFKISRLVFYVECNAGLRVFLRVIVDFIKNKNALKSSKGRYLSALSFSIFRPFFELLDSCYV